MAAGGRAACTTRGDAQQAQQGALDVVWVKVKPRADLSEPDGSQWLIAVSSRRDDVGVSGRLRFYRFSGSEDLHPHTGPRCPHSWGRIQPAALVAEIFLYPTSSHKEEEHPDVQDRLSFSNLHRCPSLAPRCACRHWTGQSGCHAKPLPTSAPDKYTSEALVTAALERAKAHPGSMPSLRWTGWRSSRVRSADAATQNAAVASPWKACR